MHGSKTKFCFSTEETFKKFPNLRHILLLIRVRIQKMKKVTSYQVITLELCFLEHFKV